MGEKSVTNLLNLYCVFEVLLLIGTQTWRERAHTSEAQHTQARRYCG